MRDRATECPENRSRLCSEEAEPSLLSVSLRSYYFGAANLEASIRPSIPPTRFKKLGFACCLSGFSCYLTEFAYFVKSSYLTIFDSGCIILRSLRSSCIPLGDVSRSSPSIYFCYVLCCLIVENSSLASCTGVRPNLALSSSSYDRSGVTPRRPSIILESFLICDSRALCSVFCSSNSASAA